MQDAERSLLRTLLIAVVVAALVALPFWWRDKNDLTGPVVFPTGDHAAGDVVSVRCPFPTRRDPGLTCYRIYVPQLWGDATSRLISFMAVVVEPIGGATRDDPFLYLEGGPGYAGIPATREDWGRNGWVRDNYGALLGTGRALIFVDTRGLGLSEPNLRCPKAEEAAWQALKKRHDPDEPFDLSDDQACFEAIRQAGVDFLGYNSEEVGQDLRALRLGLGIEKWNAYGISYGAQTLLHLLEADAGGVRSAIFDSPSYGRATAFPDDQAAFDRIIDQMEGRCESNGFGKYLLAPVDFMAGLDNPQNCKNIKNNLRTLLSRLKEDPIALRGQPFGTPVYLTDREAMLVFHSELYTSSGQSDMLSSMAEMQAQGRGYLASLSDWSMYWRDVLYWAYLDKAYSTVVHYATACREMDFSVGAPASDWPVYLPKEEQYQRDICALLDVPYKGRTLKGLSFTEVPAIVLSGDRDVITPPSYGAALAQDMYGAHLTSAEASHGLLFWHYDECMREKALAFLDDPATEPDISTCTCAPSQAKDSPFACEIELTPTDITPEG